MPEEPRYNGWIVSNSFWKRALAIWGHVMAIQFFLYILAFFFLLCMGGLGTIIEQ